MDNKISAAMTLLTQAAIHAGALSTTEFELVVEAVSEFSFLVANLEAEIAGAAV